MHDKRNSILRQRHFGSGLADTGVKIIDAYGWGVEFKKGNLQSLAVNFFGTMHLGSRIRVKILSEILKGEDLSKKSLFDAGCGVGLVSVYLANRFKRVLAADLNREKIVEAKKLAKANFIKNINFVMKDLTKFRFKNQFFDVIICLEVIEHVSDDKKFINGLGKILKRGGKIILSFPASSFINKIAQKSLDHHKVGYKPKDIEYLLEENGLKIVEEYSYGRGPLGKLVFAIDFIFKKTLPILSVIFFPLFYPILILDYKFSKSRNPENYILVIKKRYD